jgi:RNA polymerase sigma factor (sigma-70 family)
VFHVQADTRTMTPRALFHPARLARRPVLSTQSDERLVDLVRAGSDPAFEAIVERYRRALMRYVSRLLPPERAEDVVQQAFVKAYEAMHRDAAELNLRPWLYRIAHNGALNALRDRALGHAELDERIDGVERPDQAFERATGLRELVVAVRALPDRQRSAILLRELEGRSYDEIALALGVTDGAVRQLLNRARNSLRAAAAAVTPMPLLARISAGDSTEPVAARVAEMVGVGGSALAMKLCATALVTGAVVGGAAVVPDVGREHASGAPVGAEAAQAADEPAGEESADSGDSPLAHGNGGGEGGRQARGEDRSGRHSGRSEDRGEQGGSERGGDDEDERGEDHRGHGGGEPGDDREERSGRRGGDDDDDHSGPGGGGDDELEGPDDHSGPGGGGGVEEPADQPEEAREDRSGPGSGERPRSRIPPSRRSQRSSTAPAPARQAPASPAATRDPRWPPRPSCLSNPYGT